MTQAALLLGQCERSFRRYMERDHVDGLDGLLDKRHKRRTAALSTGKLIL